MAKQGNRIVFLLCRSTDPERLYSYSLKACEVTFSPTAVIYGHEPGNNFRESLLCPSMSSTLLGPQTGQKLAELSVLILASSVLKY